MNELITGSMKYIVALSPFFFCFAVITYADELIALVRRTLRPSRKW